MYKIYVRISRSALAFQTYSCRRIGKELQNNKNTNSKKKLATDTSVRSGTALTELHCSEESDLSYSSLKLESRHFPIAFERLKLRIPFLTEANSFGLIWLSPKHSQKTFTPSNLPYLSLFRQNNVLDQRSGQKDKTYTGVSCILHTAHVQPGKRALQEM